MTYKEWIKRNKPEAIDADAKGGVVGCPCLYFKDFGTQCPEWLRGFTDTGVKCMLCWSTTIPGTESDEDKIDSDTVEHPTHYTLGKVECIDAIESAVEGLDSISAYCVGNIIKYVWRYSHKNGLEDLRKANWYLNKLMDLEVDKNGETDKYDAD